MKPANNTSPIILQPHLSLNKEIKLLDNPDIYGLVLARKCRFYDPVQVQHFSLPSNIEGCFSTGSNQEQLDCIKDTLVSNGSSVVPGLSCKNILEDIQKILDVCRAHPKVTKIASGIAWNHFDENGIHIDKRLLFAISVAYIGPGAILYSLEDLEVVPATDERKKTSYRAKEGAQRIPILEGDIAILKGKHDFSKPAGIENPGCPHESPDPENWKKDYPFRLCFAAQCYE